MVQSSKMQQPTCTNMRVRNVHDAQIILHAVAENKLSMLRRRLDDDERLALRSGNIYVWEERSSNPLEANSLESIQRFTDGRSWGPSKARDDFLLYYEKEGTSRSSIMQRSNGLETMRLVKQTYSAFVDGPKNRRKWHLNAYYTQETFDHLRTIDDFPQLQAIRVPPGRYICARSSSMRKQRAASNRHSSADEAESFDSTSPQPRHSVHTMSYYSAPSYVGELQLSAPPQTDGVQWPPNRQLAPLQYLENVTPTYRNPIDDEALRSFDQRRYVSI